MYLMGGYILVHPSIRTILILIPVESGSCLRQTGGRDGQDVLDGIIYPGLSFYPEYPDSISFDIVVYTPAWCHQS
jgi:hypothetical protein